MPSRDLRHRSTSVAPRAPVVSEVVPSSAVLAVLERLLGSSQLSSAPRLCALLRFVVEQTLHGHASDLKEMRIGLDVFGRRPDSYDPAIDPIVRVQMGRLRARLRSYYEHDGASESVRIDVPVGGYVATFSRRTPPVHAVAPPAASRETATALRLAVLPITDMSAVSDDQHFCDGLTDEFIHHLAQIPGLRVVARTSTSQFRDVARDIREVGRLLDVGIVLEGSARRVGDRVRVTVQLINAVDGCHIWSGRYDGDVSDIFTIHDRIATAVQVALQSQLVTEPRRGLPSAQPLDAYNHYLQGRFLWKKRTEQGLLAALSHFEQATTLAPSFARAFAGIADCHLLMGMSGADTPEVCMPKAATAAARALRLDGSLAEAHASRGAVSNCYEWDLSAAEQAYERALELDPSYATTRHWQGLFLYASTSRLERARQCLEHAVELDPLSVPILSDLGLIHAFAGESDATDMYCRRALELDPYSHRPHWFLGLSAAWHEDYGRGATALGRALELCPGDAFRTRLLGALGFTYGRWGRHDRAREVQRELERAKVTAYVPSFELAQVALGLGEVEDALAHLEDAVHTRESFSIFLAVWQPFRALQLESRYLALLARIGITL